MTPTLDLLQGDCLDLMAAMPEASVDTVLTDPPYGLSFMGKGWDHGVPGVPYWQVALRVAKPGAMLMAFGGTRTYHRLACAIEDAGWEIRDCLMWLYGSGFPKSLDIGKALDKEAGAEREKVGSGRNSDGNGCYEKRPSRPNGLWASNEFPITAPATDAAKEWDGWGTALKPAWEPIIVAMKPCDGTFAQNAAKHGVAGMWIEGGRIGTEATGWNGNPRAACITGDGRQGDALGMFKPNQPRAAVAGSCGRWPANVILDEVAGEMLDEQSIAGGMHGAGAMRSGGLATESADSMFFKNRQHESNGVRFGDSGGASRFFYCAKASRRERGEGNNHPTVKPMALMRYLAKLTKTPTGGVVLDPFAGSGTTLLAAAAEGRDAIGCELDAGYFAIAQHRIAEAQAAREGMLIPA